ncbi:MAG: undecaprenyl/decaprenyl-phosphate alpha-N-acetylglucosaminyl 1-phosphate transferase, partial [Kiritimatiellae bacterium]|nr:undecaprenyl/decaprenyl-phosphate alpha-N-acetylglucosaminyl 1-phosphate transferase [Kiritimatiellia bacterium]
MSQSALFFGILDKALPFAMAFLGALVLTLLVTPLIRELNRSLGMVDRPGPRRINANPVPRGGGIAIVIGVFVSYTLFVLVSGRHPFPSANMSVASFWKMLSLATAISVLGLADDRFGLRPLVKLAGQLVIASLVWIWAGLGFSGVWPSLPPVADFALTVFWITGAVNAFNLIDGLDGLATGIALIATLGMAGSLFIVDTPAAAIFYFALAGGLLGFLRYNYNPASVFLGDAGSMFIGFMISSLALASQVHDSLFVSVGVPLLAMGVPIFDSSLAIMRRSVRHMLMKQGENGVGNDRIMTADADHLHHRILRAFHFDQRRAALALYAIALGAVIVGLAAMTMRSKTGGLWLVAVAIGSVVVFKNMARIELFDVGRLLELIAHDTRIEKRTFWARLAIPAYLVLDIAALAGSFVFMIFSTNVGMKVTHYTLALLVHVLSTLVALLLAGTYRTVWSRAMM